MKKSLLVLPLLVLFSCNSMKTTNKNEEVKTKMEETEKFVKEGYKVGKIISGKEKGECDFLLEIDEKMLYDPINLSEDKYASFKKADTKVYVKFFPLRRMNRCNAQPVQITHLELIK